MTQQGCGCSGASSPGFACSTVASPEVYCATSSYHVAQHHECRKYWREDVRLHLNHDACAQTELVLRPAVESCGEDQRAFVALFSLELIIGLWLTLVEAGLSHSHFSMQVYLSLLDDLYQHLCPCDERPETSAKLRDLLCSLCLKDLPGTADARNCVST